MPAFTNVNIKDLTQIEEVVSGNLLLIETETGTNTINFDNFVVGPDNVSWYTAFETVSGQVATLSADLGNVNYTERSQLSSLSAEVQLLETQFYALTSDVNTLSSNFLSVSGNVTNPVIIVYTTGFGTTTFPIRWNTAKITVVGAGGGGGGASNAVNAAGAGGGSGAMSIGYISGIGGRTYSYKIGAGGSGGANTGGNGGNGDRSNVVITSLNYGISALGGSGGNGNTSTGTSVAGGAAGSTADGGNAAYTFPGTIGGIGVANATLVNARGGDGGPGYLGQGGGQGNAGSTAGGGSPGTFGGGGGGARTTNTGGAGGSGIVIIELIA